MKNARGNVRTTFLSVRLGVDEGAALQRLANLERCSTSEALRALLRDELRRRALWPPQEVKQ